MTVIEVIVTGNDDSLIDVAFAKDIDAADKIRDDFIRKHSDNFYAVKLEVFVSYDPTGADREPVDFMRHWFK